MKQIRLIQNISRLVIVLLVIAMLFIPWCSLKVPHISKDSVQSLMIAAVVAEERGEITEDEAKEIAKKLELIFAEREVIRAGRVPEETEVLPFDFYLPATEKDYSGEDYKKQTEMLLATVHNELGNTELKLESSVSLFSILKDSVKSVPFTFSMAMYPFVSDSELDTIAKNLEYEIERTEDSIEDYSEDLAQMNPYTSGYQQYKDRLEELGKTKTAQEDALKAVNSCERNVLNETEYQKLVNKLTALGILSQSEIDTVKLYSENVRKAGFEAEFLATLNLLGVQNSDALLRLSELDTSLLKSDRIDSVWFLLSAASSFEGLAMLILVIVAPLACLGIAISELIRLIKQRKKFFEQSMLDDSNLFEYILPLSVFAVLLFLLKGITLSWIYYVLFALVIATVILGSFEKGKARNGRRGRSFIRMMYVYTAICVVVGIVALCICASYNAADEALTSKKYGESYQQELDEHMKPAEAELKTAQDAYDALLQAGENASYNDLEEAKEKVELAQKKITNLKPQIKYESINNVVTVIWLYKLLTVVYMLIIISYLCSVLKRLVLLRKTEMPLLMIHAKYIRFIFFIAIAIWFGRMGLELPMIGVFAIMMVVEVIVSLCKVVARVGCANSVVARSQKLCAQGVITEEDQAYIEERLNAMKITSLRAELFADAVDALLDERKKDTVTESELGQELRELLDDTAAGEKISKKKKSKK